MWRERWLALAVITIVVMVLPACGGIEGSSSGSAADPSPGLFRGTTSQGEQFSLRVEEVNGQLTITSIQYTIKMEAQGWTVTSEMVQPHPRQIVIENGRFSGSHARDNTTEEISGMFMGDEGAEGRLHCSHDHPQGLGRATGEVTFVAQRSSP